MTIESKPNQWPGKKERKDQNISFNLFIVITTKPCLRLKAVLGVQMLRCKFETMDSMKAWIEEEREKKKIQA